MNDLMAQQGKPLIEVLDTTDNPIDFPAALAREMGRRGWSQGELARRCGVAQPLISRYLAGAREPGLTMLCKLADALGVKLDRLRA